MKKTILAAGLTSFLSSLPAFGQERPSPYPVAVCSDWMGSSDAGEEVKNCNYYRNNQLLKDATKFYRNKLYPTEITKIERLWNGEAYDTFIFIYNIDNEPVRMNHFHGDELHMRYDFTWENGKIVEDEVHDRQGRLVRHSSDINEDGKIDHTTRYDYNAGGELIEKIIDKDGDGEIDARWDFKKKEWKPVKVYKPKYF